MRSGDEEVKLLVDQELLELCIEDGHSIVDSDGVIWVDISNPPKIEEIRTYLRETESLANGKLYAKTPNVQLADEARVQIMLDMARTMLDKNDKEVLASEYGEKLTQVCQAAVDVHASDIHIETHRNRTRILLRVDGRREVLTTFANGDSAERLDSSVGRLLANYAFNLGSTDFSTRLPLNDRFELPLTVTKKGADGKKQSVNMAVEWRIALMPLSNGIKVVLRCLTPMGEPLTLENMDLLPTQEELLRNKMQRRQGIIILTGPMGSGKTSMVYALFDTVDRDAYCCHSLEDPVEFEQEGVTKTQVEPKRELREGSGIYLDYTFYALEQLRQDIDKNMFGELRSHDTTKEFVRKGETGGVAMATLHANSALGVPSIFIEQLDIPASIVAAPDLMQLFSHQKLVRKLCPNCAMSLDKAELAYKKAHQSDVFERKRAQLEKLVPESLETVRIKNPKGCGDCRKRGEKGRLLVLELIALEDADREFISQRDYLGWKRYLEAQGWPDIRQHTLHRIALGQVDIESASEQVDGLMPVSSKSLYAQMQREILRKQGREIPEHFQLKEECEEGGIR